MATTARGRTGDQLRDELLTAATDLLSHRLAVTPPSLRETARVCGVSATAVYRYFPSQQALLIAIAGQSLASLETVIAEELEVHGNDLDRGANVRVMAVAYANWAVAHPGAYQLLFEARDLLDEPGSIDSGIERMQAHLESLLASQPSGDRDEKQQAELLWVALHGLVVTRIRKNRQRWRRTVAEDAGSFVDVFIK